MNIYGVPGVEIQQGVTRLDLEIEEIEKRETKIASAESVLRSLRDGIQEITSPVGSRIQEIAVGVESINPRLVSNIRTRRENFQFMRDKPSNSGFARLLHKLGIRETVVYSYDWCKADWAYEEQDKTTLFGIRYEKINDTGDIWAESYSMAILYKEPKVKPRFSVHPADSIYDRQARGKMMLCVNVSKGAVRSVVFEAQNAPQVKAFSDDPDLKSLFDDFPERMKDFRGDFCSIEFILGDSSDRSKPAITVTRSITKGCTPEGSPSSRTLLGYTMTYPDGRLGWDESVLDPKLYLAALRATLSVVPKNN